MSHDLHFTLTLRIAPQLRADLKTVAATKDVTPSELARTLIATGVSRELRTTANPDDAERGQ